MELFFGITYIKPSIVWETLTDLINEKRCEKQ